MRWLRPLGFGLVAALVAAGCGDGPVTPDPPAASEGLLPLRSPQAVEVARRTKPLASDEVVSKVIGPLGGTITLPRSGLTLVVPLGALSSATRITVTAPAGELVGYRFEPHGLQFRAPVIALQQTAGTELGLLGGILNPPIAAYFQGALLPEVLALEVLGLNLLGALGLAQFQIQHFSGYVIATE